MWRGPCLGAEGQREDVTALLRGHVLLSGIPESLSSPLPPPALPPPLLQQHAFHCSWLITQRADEWGPVCVYAGGPLSLSAAIQRSAAARRKKR